MQLAVVIPNELVQAILQAQFQHSTTLVMYAGSWQMALTAENSQFQNSLTMALWGQQMNFYSLANCFRSQGEVLAKFQLAHPGHEGYMLEGGGGIGLPTLYAEVLAGQLANSLDPGGTLHNSYYDTLVNSMFEGVTDELALIYYHRQLTDWLANNVIRGTFSDEYLANLSDAGVVSLAVGLSVAIGIGIFLAPTAVAQAAVQGFVTGVASDTLAQVAENIDAGRDPFALDLGRSLNAGFRGAVIGAATGAIGAAGQKALGVAKALLNPALANALCKTVTLGYNGYNKLQSLQELAVAYEHFQKGEYAQAILAARSGYGGLRAKMSSFCFIAGTLVVRPPCR